MTPNFHKFGEGGWACPEYRLQGVENTVYYFIKCFLGEGDLEVKRLALCGKVMTSDNFGAFSLSSSHSLETPTLRRNQAHPARPDRMQHCCGGRREESLSPSRSLSLSLSLFSPL